MGSLKCNNIINEVFWGAEDSINLKVSKYLLSSFPKTGLGPNN